ncbi:MAG: DNA alkylation repair protein [Acidobacteria bacterium]|nr:DNA alkylation repair protein [Acidobacteriota bacterium]MCB9397949.1 DNA alkylation repair protein [Acidobacteriota bacterium]
MAEALKDQYGPAIYQRMAVQIQSVWPDFPQDVFLAHAAEQFENKSLMDRARAIALALGETLPVDFQHAASIIKACLGPIVEPQEVQGMAPFYYLPFSLFVADRGLPHFETAMQVQHALTQRFSCEFSIRTFLQHMPEQTLAVLAAWTRDPSPHVRRLVSEGTRPRLPWATRLPQFQADPRPVYPLLCALRDDSSLYVRRSVANHLNDIAKDHPAMLLDWLEDWAQQAPPTRQWVIRHALRSLIKQGHPRALSLLGFGDAQGLLVDSVNVSPSQVPVGQKVHFSCRCTNQTNETKAVVFDFQIHFQKARGQTQAKVFKWTTRELAPGEAVVLSKHFELAQRTTRVLYPGQHSIDALINGKPHPLGHFTLQA